MAAQFDVARVFYQPQGAEPVQDLSRGLERNAAQLFSFGQQAFAQANAHFDRALAAYNDMAVENATKDAAGTINRDGDGVLVAPSSFYPSGLHSAAYAQAYRKASTALYRENALSDFQTFAEQQRAVYPTDPAALKTVLDERRTRMVTGLAEDQKTFVDLTLQQVISRTTTQVGVNLQAATNKATLEDADRIHGSVVDEAVRRVSDWQKVGQLPSEERIKAVGEAVLNDSVLKERWEGLEAMWRRAGIAEPQIARFRAELGFSVLMKQGLEHYKNMSFTPDAQGRIDRGEIAGAQEDIRNIAKTFPGRQQQVEQVLNQGLDYAVNRSQNVAAGVALRDQRSIEPTMREFYRLGIMAQQAKGNPDEQRRITDDLNRKTLDILNDSKLSDSSAMRAAAAGQQAGGMSLGALQESYSNRMIGLSNIINSTGGQHTVDQKAAAYTAAREIQDSPDVVRHMTPGQQTYLQGMIDKVGQTRMANDHAGILIEAAEGRTTPAVFGAEVKKMVDKGMYGTTGSIADMGVVAAMLSKQKDAYEKRLSTQVGARDALAAAAAGRPLTDTQKKAVTDALPFRLPGEESAPDAYNPGNPSAPLPTQSFDVANQAHVQRAIDYVRTTGIVPDRVKEAFGAMPRTPDPRAMAPYQGMYEQVYMAAAERHHRLTGQKASDKELRTEVAEQLGEQAAVYLATVQRYGADAAFKLDIANATKTSITGALGESTDAAAKSMQVAADNFTSNLIKDSAASTYLAKLGQGRIPFTQGWSDSERERAANTVLNTSPDVTPGLYGNVTGTRPSFTGGLKFEPQAQAFLTGIATAYLATDGNQIAAVTKGETSQDYAFRATVEKYAQMGVLELTTSADGTQGVIGFKSFAKAQGERMGIGKMSDAGVQASLSALVSAEARVKGGIHADYDPNSITAMPILDGSQLSWFVAAREKTTGAPVSLGQFTHDDPRLGAQAMAGQKAALDAMYGRLVDESGKPIPRSDVERLAAAIATTVQAPVEQWLKKAHAEGSFTTQAYTQEVDRHLRRLNEVAGVASAPDWRKSMANIDRDRTPDSGLAYGLKGMIRGYREAQGPEHAIPARP